MSMRTSTNGTPVDPMHGPSGTDVRACFTSSSFNGVGAGRSVRSLPCAGMAVNVDMAPMLKRKQQSSQPATRTLYPSHRMLPPIRREDTPTSLGLAEGHVYNGHDPHLCDGPWTRATERMCYGVKARTEMALRIAKMRGHAGAVEKLMKLFDPYPELDLHFANGFAHPQLVAYTDVAPHDPQLMHWGLIPAWVKDLEQADELWDRTLIARGETMFEKPAFKRSARHQRCLIFVDGFYEHHHFGKRTYPYFIHFKDRPQFALAGLWERWTDKTTGAERLTFSIVTTEPNDLMQRIHNNPNVKGARMPVILTEEEEDLWLAPVNSSADETALKALIKPYPTDAMAAHPVAPLLGKEGRGNAEGASDEFFYPELVLADPLA